MELEMSEFVLGNGKRLHIKVLEAFKVEKIKEIAVKSEKHFQHS